MSGTAEDFPVFLPDDILPVLTSAREIEDSAKYLPHSAVAMPWCGGGAYQGTGRPCRTQKHLEPQNM